ncbi:MAG: heterodisulfide reductase-related iron-sulfur binding cluster, partial [Planctomycetota bacterium]
KKELRHFVAGEDAKLVSENTYELMNYLYGLFKEGKLKRLTSDEQSLPRAESRGATNEEYVYHLPCHLCAVGKETASIELLGELCGIKVTDLKAGCCGLAGTFGMQQKNYELSSQISASLKDALEKSPIKTVLTECAACKMQIEHISDCVVRHPVKILAEAYQVDH